MFFMKEPKKARLFLSPYSDFFRLGMNVKNLVSARNYYQVLSSIAGVIFSIAGLILGYVYYIHKIRTDEKNALTERKRIRIEMLINELRNYDELVNDFFSKGTQTIPLKKIREKIVRSGDYISTMLNLGEALFGFSDEDIKKIIRVHSFIEQNNILMEDDNLELIDLELIKNDYYDYLQAARLVCFNKLE